MRGSTLAVLLSLAATAAQADPTDDLVARDIRDLRIPGLSLAVVKEGRVVKAAGYGLANLETRTSATALTVYKTASLSKSVIAAAVMVLAQDGKLGLDDKVSRYLTDAPEAWANITLRQVLNHTSGIVRDPPSYDSYREQPVTDVITAAYALPLNAPPGEKWLYSNIGYYVLAEIVSRASGEPWERFAATRLLGPARMTATRSAAPMTIVENRAGGYTRANNLLVNAENWIAQRPSGAFMSPVLDVAKWDQFLESSDVLTAASRAAMWTPGVLTDGVKTNYGFGWYVDSYLGRARIHHDGQFPGFRADHERFPEERLSVIVLANADAARLDSLALKIAGFYAPALAAPPFTLSAAAGADPASGTPVEITVTAKADGKAAPDSVLEIEIWDTADKSVFKQSRARESFAAGEARTFTFTWTPTKADTYQVNLGIYGPRFTPNYAIKSKAAMIVVK